MSFSLHGSILVLGLVAIAVAYVLTWLARFVAPRLGFVDCPDGVRKKHRRPIPLMGGLAVCLSADTIWLLGRFLGFFEIVDLHATSLFVSIGLVCGIGLWDDRRPIRARNKVALQIVACLPFLVGCGPMRTLEIENIVLSLGWLAYPTSVFWLLACMNSINLLDGEDGLVGSLGITILLFTSALAIAGGDSSQYYLALVMAFCIGGFLIHNWSPARIFLGDAGSLSIGMFVGATLMSLARTPREGFAPVYPILLMAAPFLDTTVAIARRVSNAQGIAVPDREHLHHRLRRIGMDSSHVVASVILIASAFAFIACFSAQFANEWLAIVAAFLAVGSLVGSRVFGYEELISCVSWRRGRRDGDTGDFRSLDLTLEAQRRNSTVEPRKHSKRRAA